MTTKVLSFPARRATPRAHHHPVVAVFGALLLLGMAFWFWLAARIALWLWRVL